MNRTELEQALKPLGFTFEDGPEWMEGRSFYIKHPNYPDWYEQLCEGMKFFPEHPFELVQDMISEIVRNAEDRCLRW